MDNAILSFLLRLAARAKRIPPMSPPGDPDAAVRQPRSGGSGGQGTSAAVAEPDPPIFVRAVASSGMRDSVMSTRE